MVVASFLQHHEQGIVESKLDPDEKTLEWIAWAKQKLIGTIPLFQPMTPCLGGENTALMERKNSCKEKLILLLVEFTAYRFCPKELSLYVELRVNDESSSKSKKRPGGGA